MIDITVKTLDSQNHSFTVPDEITVRQFKEKIAQSVGVTADKQRLIYCGRVLQDDKKLSEYDVNGKVIHLVQRPPPQSRSGATSSSSSSTPADSAGNAGPGHRASGISRDGNSFLLGAFTIPSDVIDPAQVQQIVQQVVSGMGEFGRNATVMSRTSDDGSSVDVHINLGQVPVPVQSESQQVINQAQTMLRLAHQALEQIGNVPPSSQNNADNSTPVEMETDRFPVSDDIPLLETLQSAFPQNSDGEGATANQPSSNSETTTSPRTTNIAASIARAARAAAAVAAAAGVAGAAAAAGVAGAAAAAAARTAGVSRSSNGIADTANVAGATSSSDEPAANSSTPDESATNASSQPSTNGGNASRAPVHPHTAVLADLMDEVQQLTTSLQPHLNNYLALLRDNSSFGDSSPVQTSAEAQQLFNRISEVLHYLSHAYHAISDLMVDMNQTPPRTLHARPLPMQQPTAILQAGIPIQAQINVSTNLNAAAASNASSATATSSTTAPATTTTATASESAAASVPQPDSSTNAATSSRTALPVLEENAHPIQQMAGLFASQNPILFMEVGPSSITIDSISATMVADTQPSSTTAGRGNRGTRTAVHSLAFQHPPPPEFFQNLMHAVGQATAQRTGTNGQSQARGNTSTNTTTSTQTRSTARPVQTIPVAIPGFGVSTFDPYLPCSSHHVFTRHAMAIRASGGAARSTPSHQGAAANANAQQGDNQLSGMITNIISQLLNQSRLQPQPAGQPTGDAPAPAPTPLSGRNILTTAVEQPTASQNVQIPLPMTDPLIYQLLQGIVNQMTASSINQNSSIGDYLVSNENFNFQEGESLIRDLFMCIVHALTFRDLYRMFFGQMEPLNRLHPRLRQFVHQRVLHNQEPTEENINSALRELEPLWMEHIHAANNEANIVDGINFIATMKNYAELRVKDLIQLILTPDENSTFGSSLYAMFWRVISEFIAICLHCFQDGQQSLERVIQGRIRALTTDLSPQLQQWTINICNLNLSSMIANNNVSEDQIRPYIIRTSDSSGEPAGATLLAEKSKSSGNKNQSMPVSQSDIVLNQAGESLVSSLRKSDRNHESTEPMDTDDTDEDQSFDADTSDRPMSFQGAFGLDVTGDLENAGIATAPWQDTVPAEWVPIITKDIQNQRRHASQPPFSDAYIGNMPSKRRKMMTANHLPSSLDVHAILPEALRRSVVAARVQPLTSLEIVTKAANENQSLQSTFNDQLKGTIRRRLQTDRDYNPDRFPNSEKYFFGDP